MQINLKKLILVISLLFTSCNTAVQSDIIATTQPLTITATLPPTTTTQPSETPLPSLHQKTTAPLEGITSAQLNVRAEPSTASEVLGIIAANANVQITGKDIGESWWQIIYDAGAEGKGWVTAQYVETGDSSQIPVIGRGGANPQLGNTAIVIQQLNIRSGPGTSFDSIGTLNADDVVNLTGRNSSGSWLQIKFAAGPEGSGWVNSGFIKTDTIAGLPILSDEGNMLGTGTPVDTPLPPTPTIVPAPMDFDSADAPLKTVILEVGGPQTVLFNGDVSSPEGDIEDWISVTTQEDFLFISVKCTGNKLIKIKIIEVATELPCNEVTQPIPVAINEHFLIHIQAIGSENQLQYTKYTLEIKLHP
ncbi:MAG TPA: SH3 domain-containing protein [Anaerolineales bacterium]|nr:SH3 domain-containing protein [Anaerolineales bacterium]